MAWEQRSTKIVMLTNLVEQGKVSRRLRSTVYGVSHTLSWRTLENDVSVLSALSTWNKITVRLWLHYSQTLFLFLIHIKEFCCGFTLQRKCEQYWPETKDPFVCTPMTIRCKKITEYADFVIRDFVVEKVMIILCINDLMGKMDLWFQNVLESMEWNI